MICEIICIDGFLCMSHLDIVHMLSAHVDVIHTLSGHMHIMPTLFAVVLDIFLRNRQCQCHPYVISSTLYIFFHVQLSFCTLSAQMHIVHVICMLSTHVHIICLSSLPLLIYLSIGGSKGGCQGRAPPWGSKFFHFHAVFGKNVKNNSNFGSWRPPLGKILDPPLLSIHNLVSTHCLHTCILCVTMSSVYCLEMHMLCTCHLSYFVVFL